METLKEYKWIIIGLLIIAGAFLLKKKKLNTLKKRGKYSIGKVVEKKKAKYGALEYHYRFSAYGESHKGYSVDLPILDGELVLKVGNHYLVIYDPYNLETSHLLPHRLIPDGEINLDSLNALGVDPSDFDWTDM